MNVVEESYELWVRKNPQGLLSFDEYDNIPDIEDLQNQKKRGKKL